MYYKVTIIKKDYVKQVDKYPSYEHVLYFLQSHSMDAYESITIRRVGK